MNIKIREWIPECARLCAAIGAFKAMGLLPIKLDFALGQALTWAVEAAVASLIVYIVSDVFLGRPQIVLSWRARPGDPPASGRMMIGPGPETINLTIEARGKTWLQGRLHRISTNKNLQLNVVFRPVGVVTVNIQHQSPPSSAILHHQNATVEFNNVSLAGGTSHVADITLRPRGATTFSRSLEVDVSACWTPYLGVRQVILVRVDSGIEGLSVRGS